MNASSPLFRKESIEARRTSWLGRPTIVSGFSRSALAIFAIAFVSAALAFVTFGEYTRRVRVTGVILPEEGLTRMVASQTGRVMDLKVREGDNVQAGDILYIIGIDSTTSLGDTQGDIIAVLRARTSDLRTTLTRQDDIGSAAKSRLSDQIANSNSELGQVDAQVGLLQQFTQDMKEFAAKQHDLMSRGISISRDYESRLQAYNAQRLQLEALKRDRIQLQAKTADLANELSAFDLDASEKKAAIRQQLLELEQQISQGEAMREVRITAPRSGTVTGVITLVGQTVTTGTPLLTIVPKDRPLVAQLLAPSSAIGFVRQGSSVLLRYEAFPYQKFGQYAGRVSLISRATLRPEEVAQLNAGAMDPRTSPSLYRITVAPQEAYVSAYGRQEALQAGMQVEAHILAESRPLYQWILAPIYGLRGSVSSSAGGA